MTISQVQLALGLCVSTLLGCAPAPMTSRPPVGMSVVPLPPEPDVEEPPAAKPRWHRGDWEAPDVLLVAYESAWRDSLAALVAAAIDEVQTYVVVRPTDVLDAQIVGWLRALGSDALLVAYDTPWIRDYGPLQVHEDGLFRWLDFFYTNERPNDDHAPTGLAREFHVPLERWGVTLDGGALISNGNGLCALTATSFDEAGVVTDEDSRRLFETLGCRVVALLPPLPGEETGHADMIAQFLATDIVAVSELDGRGPPGVAEALDEAVEILTEAAAHTGSTLEVVRIPLAVRRGVFYSFVNATALRRSYLVPSYRGLPALEREAYRRIREALPEMEISPVPADTIAEHGGSVHCMTLGLNVPTRRKRG